MKNDNKNLRDTKDNLEGNSFTGLVLGIKEVVENFKKGCTAISSSCGIKFTEFDDDDIDWNDVWDDDDSSCIFVEQFHY